MAGSCVMLAKRRARTCAGSGPVPPSLASWSAPVMDRTNQDGQGVPTLVPVRRTDDWSWSRSSALHPFPART
eukprot:1391002-Pyramimonas_sp.AAC.1